MIFLPPRHLLFLIRECGNEVVDRTALFNSRLRAAGDGGDGDGVKNRDVPLFLPSFLLYPLSSSLSLSSLFVLSGHKTPFAKRRRDDDAIKEGLHKEARLVTQATANFVFKR